MWFFLFFLSKHKWQKTLRQTPLPHPHRQIFTLLPYFPLVTSYLNQHFLFLRRLSPPHLIWHVNMRLCGRLKWLSCLKLNLKKKTCRSSIMLQCLFSHTIDGMTNARLRGLRRPVAGLCTARSQTALQDEPIVLHNHPTLERADGAAFFFFFNYARHPPNSGLLSAPSISVQLPVWPSQFPSNSCSQAKQSIDPVYHFHTRVSEGWWC